MGALKLDTLEKRNSTLRVVSGSGRVRENEHLNYYVFGLDMEGNWSVSKEGDERYRYNGKEMADKDLGWYDYGARSYMPDLGRFTRIDRFAEEFAFQSGYAYAQNNPIRYIEINGDSIPSLTTYFKDVIGGAAHEGKMALSEIAGIVSDFLGISSMEVSEDGSYNTPGGMLNTAEGGRGEENHTSDNFEGGANLNEILDAAVNSNGSMRSGVVKRTVEGSEKVQELGVVAAGMDYVSTGANKAQTAVENAKNVPDLSKATFGKIGKVDTVKVGGSKFQRTTHSSNHVTHKKLKENNE